MAHVRELSPRGVGGVSVLELAGARALELFSRRLEQASPGRSARAHSGLAPGRLARVRLAMGGEELDEALVWCESESRVELHLHGSPPLVRRVEEELVRAGFERWSPAAGPRSIEERALSLLPHAPSEAGARMLLDQAEGALSAELRRCAKSSGAELRARLESLAERARLARYLLEPARVVLAGVVNAGKSTLFNAMVGSDRALVTAAAGTTRDVLCESAHVGDWPLSVFDTAGERELSSDDPAGTVEAEGQALGVRARARADVVLWLTPADAEAQPGPEGSIAIVTRADLAPDPRARAATARLPRLAALPDPIGASAIVGRVLREALNLPERAWDSGAGVPFEPWMERALRLAAASADASVLDELERAR